MLMNFSIRKAKHADLPQLWQLVADCVAALRAAGIDQWDATNPSEETIQADVAAVMHGSYRKQPPTIQGTGYVVKSFEAALWAFYHFDDFKTGALAAVNLGQDADTTGAIYGQLAGAVWGESQIPVQWRQRLVKPLEISWRAEALLSLAWPTLTAFS